MPPRRHDWPADRIPDPIDEPTLEVERAGRFLGLSRGSSYEAVRRGDLPAIRVGRRVMVPTAQLRRMVGLE